MRIQKKAPDQIAQNDSDSSMYPEVETVTFRFTDKMRPRIFQSRALINNGTKVVITTE